MQLEPIPADTGREGYTLDRSPVHYSNKNVLITVHCISYIHLFFIYRTVDCAQVNVTDVVWTNPHII